MTTHPKLFMPCSQMQRFVQTSSNNVTLNTSLNSTQVHPQRKVKNHQNINSSSHLKMYSFSTPWYIYVNTHVSTVTPPLVSPCLSVGCLPTSEDHVAAAQQRNVDEAGSSSERGPAIRPSRSRLLSGFTNLAASPYHPCMVCVLPPLPVTGTTRINNHF